MVLIDPTTKNDSTGVTGSQINFGWSSSLVAQITIPIYLPLAPTASPPTNNDFLLFNKLVDQWQSNTRGLSSNKIIYDDAYQEIIGFGKQALPWIFSRLEKENDHWYWALACISHEWPVPEAEQGNMPAMRARWLDWGARKGYLG